MVWLADNRHAVVTAEVNKALIKVDVEEGKVVQAVDTGQKISHMVAVTPDGSRAFVANIGSHSITAIDLEEGKHLKDVPTGKGAEGIDVTPDGKHVWITNRAEDTVSVVDASSLEIVKNIKIEAPEGKGESFPIRTKATPDGRHVLVTNAASGDLAVLDRKDYSLKHRFSFKGKVKLKDTENRLFRDRFGDSSVPIGVVIDPASKQAFVAHANADVITILDLDSWKVKGTLTAGREPDGMGFSTLDVNAKE